MIHLPIWMNIYIWWFLFSCQVVSDSVTPWSVACQAPLSSTNSQSLLKYKSIVGDTI